MQGVFLRPVRRAVAVRVILGRWPFDGAIAGACDSTRSAQRRPSREIRAVTLKRNVSLSGPPHTHGSQMQPDARSETSPTLRAVVLSAQTALGSRVVPH